MLKKNIFLPFLMLVCVAYSQNIKTIQLKSLKPNDFSAIVRLGEPLELSFDDLEADQKAYSYKIEQMTFDWKTSDLSSNEYIDGFDQNNILNYENSFNTLQSYTHYTVKIPNASTKITKSGNYVISVLDENEEVVFSRRFTLYESIATVGLSVTRSRDSKTRNEQQTVKFAVHHAAIKINYPAQEIKIAVLQNNNWQTAISHLKPQYYKTNLLEYKYIKKANFWGGNEFLNFDNKAIRNTNLQIAKVTRKDIYHHYLYPQEIRATKPYTYNPDINGYFVVRSLEGNNSGSEADYARVHFALEASKLNNKQVYVYGAFNNFEVNETTKMRYDTAQKMYVSDLLLKQGFYNYRFVTKDLDNQLDFNEIGGSFYQTENEYTILVYYKPFGARYDRVIGIGTRFFNQEQ